MIKNMKKANELANHVVGLHRVVKKFTKKIHVRKLEWITSFGVGDAAHTGMLAGVIWGLKGNFIGLLYHYTQVEMKPKLIVNPLFTQLYSETNIACMLSFRIGHAIIAAIRLLKQWKKLRKGGVHHARASNSGVNDNRYGKLKAHD
jgi:hypothetical protein